MSYRLPVIIPTRLIPATGESNEPSISRDGNRVSFRSRSSLLNSGAAGC